MNQRAQKLEASMPCHLSPRTQTSSPGSTARPGSLSLPSVFPKVSGSLGVLFRKSPTSSCHNLCNRPEDRKEAINEHQGDLEPSPASRGLWCSARAQRGQLGTDGSSGHRIESNHSLSGTWIARLGRGRPRYPQHALEPSLRSSLCVSVFELVHPCKAPTRHAN